jgi:endonuclease YncB( thermonuclease family)
MLHAQEQQDPVLIGIVTKVTDGDTIVVELISGPIIIRLDSIDAPERDQPWGSQSSDALAERIEGQPVSVEIVSQDRYERLVGIVYLNEVHINAWLVEQGHAWAYRQYLSDPNYCELEGEARSAKRGVWSLPLELVTSPWDWRHFRRGQIGQVTDYSNETIAECISAIGRTTLSDTFRSGVESQRSEECRIKGNISNSGRIYHVPGSRSYDTTRIDPSRDERWFCSEEEATAAGWRAPQG